MPFMNTHRFYDLNNDDIYEDHDDFYDIDYSMYKYSNGILKSLNIDNYNGKWKTKQGELLDIKDMKSSHINNCINMINKRCEDIGENPSIYSIYNKLIEELIKRSKKEENKKQNKKQKIIEEKENILKRL